MSPRKKKRQPKRRLRGALLVAAALAALLAWGVAYAVAWPGFRPKTVGVVGARVVPQAAVRAAARVGRDANVWLIDPWALAARVEAIPFIDTARLERKLPNVVAIVVTERKPEACVRGLRGATVTIDARARVLEAGCKISPLYVLPKLSPVKPGKYLENDELARLRANAAELVARGMQLRSILVDRDGGMVVARKDGVRLLLGDDAVFAEKARLVAPVLENARKRGWTVAQLDLRAPATPVVRYRETARAVLNPRTKE